MTKYSYSEDENKSSDESNAQDFVVDQVVERPISSRLCAQAKNAEPSTTAKAKKPKSKTKELLQDYPEWHPAQHTDELEMYEQAQQQEKQLYQEPRAILEEIKNNSVREIASTLLQTQQNHEWTMPLVEFLHASLMVEPKASSTYDAVLSVDNRLFLLPLFYFWNLMTTYFFQYMAVRTTTKKKDAALFGLNQFKTKHQFQVGFFRSKNALKGESWKVN